MESQRVLRAVAAGFAALQPADHEIAHALAQAIQTIRIAHHLRAKERRAQHRSMRYRAAQLGTEAVVVDRRNGIAAQQIGIGTYRQRRTPGKPDARAAPWRRPGCARR
ncbi:hypothetical protein BN2475_120037 [Paraburkholderia ribeironis]|uniref:Uncharacterized protein n=1 Tax=Paraburkholderia ribeironis TaxID=1247936 RepID=A0A1N7RQR0_9BURK|nr:hypothetical protein BN2475_120037 [Paraburkholderia ribeironis]